jgi:hypothetical protein
MGVTAICCIMAVYLRLQMDVYCFLFTDMLLVTKPNRRGDKVKVTKPPMRLDKVVVTLLRDTGQSRTLLMSCMVMYQYEYVICFLSLLPQKSPEHSFLIVL